MYLFQVCFKQAIFPLLARMRYGMYYNMPMVSVINSLLFKSQQFDSIKVYREPLPHQGGE